MTIEESTRLRNSWKINLLTSNRLTPFQIMDLENIKEEDKVSIELLDYHSLNSQLRQLFNDGKYDAIIARLSKLPIGKEDKTSLKVKMPTGKTLPYAKYLSIASARMENGQPPLKVEIVSKQAPELKKKYANMDKEEFSKTFYGRTVYNLNGQIIKASKYAFEYAWEEMIAMINEESDEPDRYFNPHKLAEWMNANPCSISTLFHSEAIFFSFLQWLADNGHIDRKAMQNVDIDVRAACKSLQAAHEDSETK